MKFLRFSQTKLGSSLSLPAHGRGRAMATSSLVAHFALQNTASNSAEKKNRPSEGVAEGGFGGNSATPERNQIVDSPAVLLIKSRTPRRKGFISFFNKKKNGGKGGNKRRKDIFCERGGAGFSRRRWGWLPYWGFCSKNVRTSI